MEPAVAAAQRGSSSAPPQPQPQAVTVRKIAGVPDVPRFSSLLEFLDQRHSGVMFNINQVLDDIVFLLVLLVSLSLCSKQANQNRQGNNGNRQAST